MESITLSQANKVTQKTNPFGDSNEDEIKVAVLVKNDNNQMSLTNITIDKIIDHIKYGFSQNLQKPCKSYSRWTSNPRKPFADAYWSYEINNESQLEKHNGLICIGLKNLTIDQRLILFKDFKTDPYTFIIFNNYRQNGLWIIAKTHCQEKCDEEIFKSQLQNYYVKNYSVKQNEFNDDYLDSKYPINQDSAIYTNLRCSVFHLDDTDASITISSYHAEPIVQKEEVVSLHETMDKPLAQKSAFDDERSTTSVMHSLWNQYEWYKHNFINQNPNDTLTPINANNSSINNIKNTNPLVIARLQLDKNNEYFLVDFTIDSTKNNVNNVRFQLNPANGQLLVGGKEEPRSLATNQLLNDEKAGHYLAQLLEQGKLIHGDVRKLIEEKLGCKERTARTQLNRFLSNPPLLQSIVGKPIRLAESRAGKLHYLFLEPID